MSFNGVGVFQINSAGQPVVIGTIITDTEQNLLTADLATGLSNTICKDGQQTCTAIIPFALGLSSAALVDLSASTAGQIKFPATQNPSANPNTLDDYEEGTCTILDISGGTTFTDLGSTYTKVGRQVVVCVYGVYGAAGGGTSTALGGFPFAINTRSSAMVLCDTSQASGVAFSANFGTFAGGFQTIVGAPTPIINSTMNSTTLGFVLTYFT